MGEKEIKPQPQPGGVSTAQPAPFPTTTERPGTGTSGTSKGGGSQPPRPGGGGSGGGGGWTGSALYPDGFRMGREQGGDTTLTDPSGQTATWDPGAEQWKSADGKAMPDDWSAGHRPTKYDSSTS